MTGLLERLRTLDAEQRRYTLETLVARLCDVGQLDRLRVLLGDDAWMQGRFAGDGGVYDGYRADLALAWDAMAGEARRQIDAGGDLPALADCWRIALIQTSLNSIAGNFPPALVAQAIRTGYWTAEKAFGVVPNIADVNQKQELCIAVLESGVATPAMSAKAQELALALMSDLQERDRSKWLVRLVPLLDERYLARARQTAEAITESQARAPALVAVAVRLNEREKLALLDAALQATQTMSSQLERPLTITLIARQLSGAARDRALEDARAAALAIGLSGFTLKALAPLIDFYSGEAQHRLIQDVLERLWTVDDSDFGYSLAGVLAHLPEAMRAEVAAKALARAKDLSDMDREFDSPRPMALMALAPYLDATDLEQVLAIAKSMSDGQHLANMRASVFATLAMHSTGARRTEAMTLALAAARADEYGPYRVNSLIGILPVLDHDERETVVKEALAAAFSLWDEKPNQGMLGEVSPRLEALTKLAPYLSGELLSDALGNASVIKDKKERAVAFLALARSLVGSVRHEAMRLSYESVWDIRDDQSAIFTVEEIFAGLDADVAAVAFSKLDELSARRALNDWCRLFAALAPRLSADEFDRAAEISAQIEAPQLRAEAYTVLVAHAQPAKRDLYQKLFIDSIRAIPDYLGHLTARVIRDAAPHLHGAHAEAAWKVLLEVEGHDRSQAIAEMAPQLRGEIALTALPVMKGLENAYHRAAGLMRLSSALPAPHAAEARSAAFAAAMGMSAKDHEAEKAIFEVLPHLTGDERRRALLAGRARARYFGQPEMAARTFVQLASFMSARAKSSALAAALERAVEIESADTRAEVLASIFGQMKPADLRRALQAVLAIETAEDRCEVLASLAPFLSAAQPSLVRRHVVERLFGLRDANRTKLLALFAHPAVFAAPIVPDELRARLVHDLDDVCSRWRWQ